jgi:hypothetical protein
MALRRNGVVQKLRIFFEQYPNSKPATGCRVCGLDPRKYSASARVIKCQVRKRRREWSLESGGCVRTHFN